MLNETVTIELKPAHSFMKVDQKERQIRFEGAKPEHFGHYEIEVILKDERGASTSYPLYLDIRKSPNWPVTHDVAFPKPLDEAKQPEIDYSKSGHC